jgi:hypothetical protein
MRLVQLTPELLKRVLEWAGESATCACAATDTELRSIVELLALQSVESIEQAHRTDPSYRTRAGLVLSKVVGRCDWDPSFVSSRLLEAMARRCHLYTLPAGHRGCLTLASDGTHIYSAGHDGVTRCWDLATRTCTMQLTHGELAPRAYGMPMHACVTELAVNASGSRIVSVADGDGLRIWNAQSQQCEVFLQNLSGLIAVAENKLFVMPLHANEAGIASDAGVMLAFDLISGMRLLAVELPWLSEWVFYPSFMAVGRGSLFVTWAAPDEEEEDDNASDHIGVHVFPTGTLQRRAFLPGESLAGTPMGSAGMIVSEDGRVLATVTAALHVGSQWLTTYDTTTLTKLSQWDLSHRYVARSILHPCLLCEDALYVGVRFGRTSPTYASSKVAIDVWDVHSRGLRRRLVCPTGGAGHSLSSVRGIVRVGDTVYAAFNSGDISESVTGTVKAYIAI